PPVIEAFAVDAPKILPGQAAQLNWRTNLADRVYLDDQPVDALGGIEVRPDATREYSLLAVNGVGETLLTLQVAVLPKPATAGQAAPGDRGAADRVPARGDGRDGPGLPAACDRGLHPAAGRGATGQHARAEEERQ